MSHDDWLTPLESIRAHYANGTLFGARLGEVERGRTRFILPITPEVSGGVGGGVHGGILASMADIAVVAAVLSSCRRGDQMRGTAELNISYIRPALGRALTVTATVLRKGSILAVGDVEMHGDSGKLVAKGRVTYALGRKPGP